MSKRIVILGGGTGGTLTANRLRRELSMRDASITVIDQDDQHVYQPGLLFIPFGLTTGSDIVRIRHQQLHHGIDFISQAIDHVDIDAEVVHLADGQQIPYDLLVVATGAVLSPEETDGLTWSDTLHTFYDLAGATALADALSNFDAGRLVVNVVDMPIKCPVAPLEFCFLADWYFTERGNRHRVDITYVTPLDAAFTKPIAAERLGGLLADKHINLVTEFNTGQVDDTERALVAYDGRRQPYDLAVVIPMHSGASYVGRSPGLGDDLNFVPTNPNSLQSEVRPNIFVIGDATTVPASKAGSVTHFEGEVLIANILRFLSDEPLDASYDGHANCFIETGFGKALLIDFNYDTEPLPGHYPGRLGMPLLKESRMNHLGKMMFQWFYWHGLLPGRNMPGISADMPAAGKVPPGAANEINKETHV